MSHGLSSAHARHGTQLGTLQVKAQDYFARGLAESSHRTYTSAQRQFLQFCRDFSLDPLPASEDTLILFSTHLAQRIKPQSLHVYLAAVRSLHVAQGLANPLQPGLKLKQTLRGIERQHFSPPKQKMPLTFDILRDIHSFLNPSSIDDTVHWAAITTGHFLMLRAGEFTVPSNEEFDTSSHLTAADAKLHTSSDGMEYLTVHIKRSKTDQRGQGVTLYTGHSGHRVCAVCAMKKNLAIRGRPVSSAAPLFQLADSSPVTKAGLLTFVSHLLRLIGIDPSQYSGHSFRIGGATSASLAGLSDYEIKLIGRWNSDCYRRYIRSPLNLFLGYPRKIAQTQAIQFQYATPYTPTDDEGSTQH